MFGIGKLLGAAIDLALTPVEIVKDVATMGGTLTDQDTPYTYQRLNHAYDKVDAAAKELAE